MPHPQQTLNNLSSLSMPNRCGLKPGLPVGMAPPYHNRRASNGEIYDMHAMTAAHRTLPLGTIVRVTDVKTGSSAIVRITDRGPFIEGRIIDLSRSAAEKVGIVQRGTAEVRVDVLKTPSPVVTADDGRCRLAPSNAKGSP